MAKPEGKLTGAQLEIMEMAWDAGGGGITVGEIHDRLREQRNVARTTALTLVRRLHARGWLTREVGRRADLYRAACSRRDATGRIAGEFVDEFFGGSATDLVKSLLGSRRIKRNELRRLRELLDEEGKR